MNQVLSWETHEHHHVEKTSDWYWALGIITISIAILCIIFNNILFSIFIILCAITSGLHVSRKPQIMHIELGMKGILMESRFYSYSSLESFWIEEEEHLRPSIILKSEKMFMPLIVIPIDDIPAGEIREHLGYFLPEVMHKESVFHRIMEYFGF